jgi:hypothetical protein
MTARTLGLTVATWIRDHMNGKVQELWFGPDPGMAR